MQLDKLQIGGKDAKKKKKKKKKRFYVLLVAELAGQGDLVGSDLVGDLEGARLQVLGDIVGNLVTLLLLMLDLALNGSDKVLVGCNEFVGMNET
jgi:hypothetical protein